MKKLIQQFINSTNAFDVEAALMLFASDAVIDDISVGEKFTNSAGVRIYLEKFFVGYHTVTKLESLEVFDERRAKAQVDFTGDFGHETGSLDVIVNEYGLIVAINAYLDWCGKVVKEKWNTPQDSGWDFPNCVNMAALSKALWGSTSTG